MSVPAEVDRSPIPITVFTGFLGAGKTTIILSLLPQLPKGYRVVLLKNEFGDVAVDSELAKQSSLAAVSEILNGCMCCVLVGQMKTALLEIREKYRPDRIIIECSGSAFPATLAFQIRELERETTGDLKLDAIVTVVDAENFIGYEDTSPTAKMQSQYTDLIIINKWEHISERSLDIVVDHLNTLNDFTPKVKSRGRDGVSPDIIFALDSKLFLDGDTDAMRQLQSNHHDEVETVTVRRGGPALHAHVHDGACHHNHGDSPATDHGKDASAIEDEVLANALSTLPKESIWRVKGFLLLQSGPHILNWAFGRYDLTKFEGHSTAQRGSVQLTVMGERGEVKRATKKFVTILNAEVS